MKNRRKLRHIRTVLLSLTTVGLFCLCVWLFYQGLFEQDGAAPLPVSEPSSRPTLEISSAEPPFSIASSNASQGGADASLGEPIPMASSAAPESALAVSESAAVSSDPAAVSSAPASVAPPAPASEAPAASSVSAAPASSAAPTTSLPEIPADDPYPDLYVARPEFIPHQDGDKVVYLTFDDGPSNLTIPLLDVLDKYGVKATFFVVGKTSEEDKEALRQTAERGHTLAVHSYTHEYKQIYASPRAFLDDFAREYALIKETTGVSPTIYRCAGGSVNSYNRDTARSIAEEMNRRGYIYYDWNVDSGDAVPGTTAEGIYQNVISQTSRYYKAVVLMHNSAAKKDTLAQLPRIIEKLQAMGYRFAALDNTVAPINFRLP